MAWPGSRWWSLHQSLHTRMISHTLKSKNGYLDRSSSLELGSDPSTLPRELSRSTEGDRSGPGLAGFSKCLQSHIENGVSEWLPRRMGETQCLLTGLELEDDWEEEDCQRHPGEMSEGSWPPHGSQDSRGDRRQTGCVAHYRVTPRSPSLKLTKMRSWGPPRLGSWRKCVRDGGPLRASRQKAGR